MYSISYIWHSFSFFIYNIITHYKFIYIIIIYFSEILKKYIYLTIRFVGMCLVYITLYLPIPVI